jgi:hypothetical protein
MYFEWNQIFSFLNLTQYETVLFIKDILIVQTN